MDQSNHFNQLNPIEANQPRNTSQYFINTTPNSAQIPPELPIIAQTCPDYLHPLHLSFRRRPRHGDLSSAARRRRSIQGHEPEPPGAVVGGWGGGGWDGVDLKECEGGRLDDEDEVGGG